MTEETRLACLAVRRTAPPVIVGSCFTGAGVCSFYIWTFFTVSHTRRAYSISGCAVFTKSTDRWDSGTIETFHAGRARLTSTFSWFHLKLSDRAYRRISSRIGVTSVASRTDFALLVVGFGISASWTGYRCLGVEWAVLSIVTISAWCLPSCSIPARRTGYRRNCSHRTHMASRASDAWPNKCEKFRREDIFRLTYVCPVFGWY